MSLRSANLNLIPILQALLREGNVSRAAESLGLSQPATSAALSRLRSLMGDPLLVQVGRTMRLTARAKDIVAPLEQLCSAMESLLQDNAFDPAETERTFVVAAPDYLAFLLGEPLLDILGRTAPRIQVRFLDVGGPLPEWMASGELDAAVCADVGLWDELFRLGGFADRMVAVVAKGHPLLDKASRGPAEINRYPQLSFMPGLNSTSGRPPAIKPILPGVVTKSRFQAEQFLVLPFLAAQSDGVARIPKSLADRFVELLSLEIIEAPDVMQEIDTTIFWGPVQDGDPGHRWFRGVLTDCLLQKFGAASSAPLTHRASR